MSMQQTSYQKGFGLVEILLLVVIVGLVGLVAWQLYQVRRGAAPSPTATANQALSTASKPPQQTTLSPGDDDRSLSGDLDTINNGLSQNSRSLDASDSSVNDQQNQISIPAN